MKLLNLFTYGSVFSAIVASALSDGRKPSDAQFFRQMALMLTAAALCGVVAIVGGEAG